MDEIGSQLSRTRQAQGLSVSDVAARLRIRRKFVEALENEDWHDVGEFVYVRGFLKNYADLLGLDPQPLLLGLRESYQAAAGASAPPPNGYGYYAALNAQRSSAPKNARWFPWVMGSLTVIAGALVVLLAISIFGFMSNRSAGPGRAGGQSGAPMPVPIASKADDAGALSAGTTANDAYPGGVNLRLQLTQTSWLSVMVDGKRVLYETLPAGAVREFHGAREITLRAGNAGGVMANFDGKDLGTLGQAGQVQDRVFAVKPSPNQVNGVHE